MRLRAVRPMAGVKPAKSPCALAVGVEEEGTDAAVASSRPERE